MNSNNPIQEIFLFTTVHILCCIPSVLFQSTAKKHSINTQHNDDETSEAEQNEAYFNTIFEELETVVNVCTTTSFLDYNKIRFLSLLLIDKKVLPPHTRNTEETFLRKISI